MSPALITPPLLPKLTVTDLYQLSLDQYHEMVRSGVLADAPVELLDGWLITKMSKNPPHRISVELLRRRLPRILPPGWDVMQEQPITLDTSEPEPDIVVVRGDQQDYSDRHPGTSEVPLLIEVADTTLDRDRGWKRRLYARAGLPVYWIVNLLARNVEVYSQPARGEDEPDFREMQVYSEGAEVPVVLDGREVARLAVSEILPRR
jgi:Uma2 family endonuclease